MRTREIMTRGRAARIIRVDRELASVREAWFRPWQLVHNCCTGLDHTRRRSTRRGIFVLDIRRRRKLAREPRCLSIFNELSLIRG